MNSTEMKRRIDQTKQDMIDLNETKQRHEQLAGDFSQSPLRPDPSADQAAINASADELADMRARYSQMKGTGEIVPDMEDNQTGYEQTIFYENASASCPTLEAESGMNDQLASARARFDEAMVENLEPASSMTSDAIERDKQIICEARDNMVFNDQNERMDGTVRAAENEHEQNVIDSAAAHLADQRAQLAASQNSAQIVPDIEGNETEYSETIFFENSLAADPDDQAEQGMNSQLENAKERYDQAMDAPCGCQSDRKDEACGCASTSDAIERDKAIIHEVRAGMDPADSADRNSDARRTIDETAAHLADERAKLSGKENSGQIVPDIEGNETQFEETLFAAASGRPDTVIVEVDTDEADPAADFNAKYETARDRFQTGTDGLGLEEARIEIEEEVPDQDSGMGFMSGLFASSNGRNTSAMTLDDFSDHGQGGPAASLTGSVAEEALYHAGQDMAEETEETDLRI